MALILVSFVILIRKHSEVKWKNELTREKIAINKVELNYLNKGLLTFDGGREFIDPNHDYSYDLDFFGSHSLFQHLNRTGTVTGKTSLANSLLRILPEEEIIRNQEAIAELKEQVEWRHEMLAFSRLKPDSDEIVEELTEWAKKPPAGFPLDITIFSYLAPAVVLVSLAFYLFGSYEIAGRISLLMGLLNLGVLGVWLKAIKSELITSTKIEQILRQYSFLLKQIENSSFKSEKLKELQNRLTQDGHKASTSIHELSLLFGRLEHLQNVFASPFLNGLLLFHLHVFKGLSKWKRIYAVHITDWLEAIGEYEKFNSLANFSYNNPQFTFPKVNSEHHISFEALGHPLIRNKETVTNSIHFQPESFFILTGSNMSGKSTFLRTLGINMVLAGIGAPVFAKTASFFPLPVLVSMRLSDSLADSESYFYAEVKRLKYIMDRLEKQKCFVLLDEILRGTNSDDKRNGTIEVIRKMADRNVFGGIATHDLEVCNVSSEYPDILINKRFEVEIIDDELVFDYKLRDGVCQNKSASFIMRKMKVI